jgi:hypothetical protein
MKVGDLVKFTNRNHSLYRKYSKGVGLITEIDHIAKYNRGSRQEYLGAKVTVQFPELDKPSVVTEFSLQVI